MWIMDLCIKSVPMHWPFEWDLKNRLKARTHEWKKKQPYFEVQNYFAVFLVSAHKHLHSIILMTHHAQFL